ncbi:MAG: response regulator [Candidatus Angelobacter sp.]
MSAAPTVLFIDDSATMREVIKIAFRRENMNVLATHDAGQALSDIEQTRPDIVITDVIMPGKDGYEVCQFIKAHPQLNKIPVILMSGVVNRAVAERAFSAKADELLRKPFQPQDLIARVRHLLGLDRATTPATQANAATALSAIFSASPRPAAPAPRVAAPVAPAPRLQPAGELTEFPVAWPEIETSVPQKTARIASPPAPPLPAKPANGEMTKLKVEVLRLEGLVKKLQAELQAEREYSRAMEAHIKTLQECEG